MLSKENKKTRGNSLPQGILLPLIRNVFFFANHYLKNVQFCEKKAKDIVFQCNSTDVTLSKDCQGEIHVRICSIYVTRRWGRCAENVHCVQYFTFFQDCSSNFLCAFLILKEIICKMSSNIYDAILVLKNDYRNWILRKIFLDRRFSRSLFVQLKPSEWRSTGKSVGT